MFVAVMQVRVMRMAVPQAAVRMRMGVRLLPVPCEGVPVLMMLVVHVGMRVLHRLVHVRMLVTFGQVQPDAERHERGSDPERGGR